MNMYDPSGWGLSDKEPDVTNDDAFKVDVEASYVPSIVYELEHLLRDDSSLLHSLEASMPDDAYVPSLEDEDEAQAEQIAQLVIDSPELKSALSDLIVRLFKRLR
jgi:hypothetical protein